MKVWKIILCILVVCLVLIIGLIGALPTWLSTKSGTRFLTESINKRISGQLTIEELKLSWWGGQRVSALRLTEREGHEVLSFDTFSTEGSLWTFLFRRFVVGETFLTNFNLHLIEKEQEPPNIFEVISRVKSRREEKKKAPKKEPASLKIPSFRGEVRVQNGSVTVESPTLPTVSLTDIRALISRPEKSEPTVLHLTAKAKQGNKEGSILFSGKIDKGEIVMMADVKELPIAGIDTLISLSHPRLKGLLTKALGSRLNLDGALESNSEELSLDFVADSPLLQGSIQAEKREGKLTASPSSRLTWTMTPALVDGVLDMLTGSRDFLDWRLAENCSFSIALKEFDLPLADDEQGRIEVQLSTSKLELIDSDGDSRALESLEGNLVAESMNGPWSLDVNGEWAGLKRSSTFGFAFLLDLPSFRIETNVGDFALIFSADLEEIKPLTLKNCWLLIKGDHFSATIEGEVIEGVFKLEKVGELFFDLGAQLFGAVDSITSSVLSMNVKELNVPLFPFSPGKISIEVSGDLAPILLDEEGIGKAVIDDSSFTLICNGKQNLLSLELQAKSKATGKEAICEEGSLSLRGELRGWHDKKSLTLDEAKGQFSMQGQNVPFLLIDAWLGQEGLFASLLGNCIDLSVSAETGDKGTLAIDALGEGFQLNLGFSLGKTLELNPRYKNELVWEITPERYHTLIHALRPAGQSRFLLEHPATLQMSLGSFICPAKVPKSLSPFLCQSGLTADLTVTPLELFHETTGQRITLSNLHGSLEGKDFTDMLKLNLGTQIGNGTLYFAGELLSGWTRDGKWNRDELTLKGKLDAHHLPVTPLTEIFPIDEEARVVLQALFGDTLTLSADGSIKQMEGPITVDLQASNLKGTLPLQLQRDFLVLNAPINAEITLTKEVSETFLQDIYPLLFKGARSTHPIRLTISPEGFSIPVHPFSFTGIQIERGALGLGQIWIQKGGQLQSLLDLLKAKDSGDQTTMRAWFTPVYFGMRSGIVYYPRFDALLGENLHIASWGSVDLANDKVSLVLGISPSTLKNRLGILNLSGNDMFQLTVTGTTSDVKVDWSSAAKRIALLAAAQGKGPASFIVGGLLGILSAGSKPEPTPPPTTTPFPWQ